MLWMRVETGDDGDRYETYVGRWSRLVAAEFLDWLEVPAGARWLDVGCGTGPLSETILKRAQPGEVRGIDTSEDFIAYAREQLSDTRFEAELGDATAMPFPDGSFDAVVSGLVLNFVARRRPRRHGRRVRLGLRRRHADDAVLLGRRDRPGPRRA
jgi:SAM-dependent methyltransferase